MKFIFEIYIEKQKSKNAFLFSEKKKWKSVGHISWNIFWFKIFWNADNFLVKIVWGKNLLKIINGLEFWTIIFIKF